MAVEGLVLDGLSFNAGSYLLQALKFNPAKKRPDWAEAVDGDGALLVRDPTVENSQWDVTVEVRAASRDAAHTAVGAITDKLEEAERNPLGIPLVWTPADSTKSLTFYVLTGEIGEVPITWESGYFGTPPVLAVSLTLTCRPFGYGAEQTVAAVSGAGPLQIFSLAGVLGDVPAEGRLIVTDTASQNRDYAAWGLEYRYQAGADLLLTQNELTATGFAGTSTTRAGSVSTNVYRGTLTTSPVAVCGTGNQPHIGTYRVYARVYPGVSSYFRFTYRESDGPLKSLNWETNPEAAAWNELDLGIITVPPKLLGTQRWQGQFEAYTNIPGQTVDVDYLALVPAGEGFGRARRAPRFETSTTFSARDEFDQTAGNLTGKTAAVGGTWAGAGSANDFAINTTDATAERSALSDADENTGRYAISGVAGFTAQVVQVDLKNSLTGPSGGPRHMGVLARYVDTNNWLMATHLIDRDLKNVARYEVMVRMRVAGTVTTLGTVSVGHTNAATPYSVRLQVDTSGRYWVWWSLAPMATTATPILQGSNTALAIGGALASGKPGFYDAQFGGTANTRTFDNFLAFAPTADAVCWSGQSIEFRHDDTIREDSTGTYWGKPGEYRGAPLFIPPAGDENRTSRVAVMLRRNDIYSAANLNVADNQTVEVRYTPRFAGLPR